MEFQSSRDSDDQDSMSEAELNDANDVLYKSEESWSKLDEELKEVMREGGAGSKKLVRRGPFSFRVKCKFLPSFCRVRS